MTLDDALNGIKTGASFVSDSLPLDSVLKFENGEARVVFPATGSGFRFRPWDEHIAADWRKLEGWLSYGL